MIEFKIEGDYIELISLLKAVGIAQTGGHAKHMVSEGLIQRNGQTEYRKRAKLLKGETVEVLNNELIVLK